MIVIPELHLQFDNHILVYPQSLSLSSNHLIGIMGESGCGKTTLLNILSLKNRYPIIIDGNHLEQLTDQERADFRLSHISYLQQEVSFVKGLKCYEILSLAASLVNRTLDEKAILSILNQVGLEDVKELYPYQLSGGQLQLLAIAEAIAKDTEIILCDEITSALDQETKSKVFNVLKEISIHKTIIMVFHEKELQDQFDLLYTFKEKHIIYQEKLNDIPTISHSITKFSGQKYLDKAYRKSSYLTKLISNILLILCITGCAIGYKYSSTVTNHIDYVKKMMSTYEFPINFTNSDDHFYFSEDTRHFNDSLIDEIQKINGVNQVMPVYYCKISPEYHISDTEEIMNEEDGYIMIDHQKNNICQVKHDTNFTQFQNIMIYGANLDDLSKYCSTKMDSDGTIFITSQLAFSAGINESNIGSSVEIPVLVPVNSFKENSEQITYDEEGNRIDYQEYVDKIIYKKVPMKFKLRGILDMYYPNSYSTDCFYIDSDVMGSLIQQYSDSDYRSNVYKIETKMAPDALSQELKKIDSNITMLNLRSYYDTSFQTYLENEALFKIYLRIAIVVIILVALIYSYYSYYADLKFFLLLSSQGLNVRFLKKSLVKSMISDFIMITIGSLGLTYITYRLALNANILKELGNALHEKQMVFIICIGLSIAFVLLENLISFIRIVIRNDRNTI